MAICYPDIEMIKKTFKNATEGEMYFLHFLLKNLPDDYEIYFQPFLNGDRPDFILVRKNYGIMIIEVKDWNLNNYQIDNYGKWSLKDNNISIKSPFEQVLNYKRNIYNLHLPGIAEKIVFEPKLFSLVKCAVFFYKAEINTINDLVTEPYLNNSKYRKWINNFEIITPESLIKKSFLHILSKNGFDKKSDLFSDEIYNSLKRFIQPPFHPYQDGIVFSYSPEQEKYSLSKPGEQKIKGVAGCGKTLILAKRAVNAYKRTRKKVLILTFNISMRNYIHDKINEVREDFHWSSFHIIHYHDFIKSEANNIGRVVNIYDFDNPDFFSGCESFLHKYDTILIDEGQDFKFQWFQIIKKYFLNSNGEYVIYADEKQNIYNRELYTDKRIKTNIVGRWNEGLKKTYRLSKDIAILANDFQKVFLQSKYYTDDILIDEQPDLFNQQKIVYKDLFDVQPEHVIKKSLSIILSFLSAYKIHPNDTAVISTNVSIGRMIDYLYRKITGEKTLSMFEDHEIFHELSNKYSSEIKKGILKEIRRSKKYNFRLNPGVMKYSTIHSFKGWEINTLFLILASDKNSNLKELVYTGLTRARQKLIIININLNIMHQFFSDRVIKT